MKKQWASYFTAICLAALACAAIPNAYAGSDCERKDLIKITEDYFASLQRHDTSDLPLDSAVQFTENGFIKKVGKSFWETAGEPLLLRTLIDAKQCGSATIAVMEEKYVKPKGAIARGLMGAKPKPMPEEGSFRPILFAARLKVAKKKIVEIETIIAREDEFFFNADGLLATKAQDWGTILNRKQRTPRKAMIEAADNYFNMFAADPKVSVPFAKVCDRWENGTQTTSEGAFGGGSAMPAHDCSPKGLPISNNGPRRFLVDAEKGIVAAFLLFAGAFPDIHMFRMREGKVDLILSVIGSESRSMGWPSEPAK
jgi:hypothetical protein